MKNNKNYSKTGLRAGIITFCGLLAACAPHDLNGDVTPDIALNQDSYTAIPFNGAIQTRPWYEEFSDPKLSLLIEQSFGQNFDVRAALARLDAASAFARQSGTAYLPAINGVANSEETMLDGEREDNVSRVGLNLDWEIDAFGRLRALNEADRLNAVAAAEDVQTARLALSGMVAEAYYAGLSQRMQLQLLEQQSQIDRDFLNLLELRFNEGIGNRIEVLQQQSQLAETESLVPLIEANYRDFENRLDVLLGTPPDGHERIEDEDSFPVIAELPNAGVPSDLLLNRPDLRAMQRRLVAQDAEIGAAIADRLPRITLTGSVYSASGGAADGIAGSILGALVQPLIDWGRRKAAVEQNEALYEEQLAEFTQAYLEAVEDVENALYRENRQREYIKRLQHRADILAESVEQTEAVFSQGISDYLPVLTALQSLRLVERSLIVEEFELMQNRINLYRTLGGYIPPETPETGL